MWFPKKAYMVKDLGDNLTKNVKLKGNKEKKRKKKKKDSTWSPREPVASFIHMRVWKDMIKLMYCTYDSNHISTNYNDNMMWFQLLKMIYNMAVLRCICKSRHSVLMPCFDGVCFCYIFKIPLQAGAQMSCHPHPEHRCLPHPIGKYFMKLTISESSSKMDY